MRNPSGQLMPLTFSVKGIHKDQEKFGFPGVSGDLVVMGVFMRTGVENTEAILGITIFYI